MFPVRMGQANWPRLKISIDWIFFAGKFFRPEFSWREIKKKRSENCNEIKKFGR